jgi:hypothetical protein
LVRNFTGAIYAVSGISKEKSGRGGPGNAKNGRRPFKTWLFKYRLAATDCHENPHVS